METNANGQSPVAFETPVKNEYRQRSSTAMALSVVGLAIFFLPVANIAGLVLAIIGFVKSKDCRKFASDNGLTESNTNTAGYICGLIGIILGGLGVLFTFLLIAAILGIVSIASVTAVQMLPEIVEQVLPAVTAVPMV